MEQDLKYLAINSALGWLAAGRPRVAIHNLLVAAQTISQDYGVENRQLTTEEIDEMCDGAIG